MMELRSFGFLAVLTLLQLSACSVHGKGEEAGRLDGTGTLQSNLHQSAEIDDDIKEPDWDLYTEDVEEDDEEEWEYGDDYGDEDEYEYYDDEEDDEYEDYEEEEEEEEYGEYEIGYDGENQILSSKTRRQKIGNRKLHSTQSDDDIDCVDDNDTCSSWASLGECDKNPNYMLTQCRKSCQTCSLTPDELSDAIQEKLEEIEEQKRRAKQIKKDFGVKQAVHHEKTPELIQNYTKYMNEVVLVESRYEPIRADCQNRETLCSEWAVMGECEANPNYMLMHCAVACQTCHELIFSERCPWNSTTHPNCFKPGEMNQMFQQIATSAEFEGQINVLSNDPWVITIDNFVKPEEADRLIALGGVKGYERSLDVGEKNFDGTYKDLKSDTRTSTNAWCDEDCEEDPLAREVIGRIHRVTGVPYNNSEHLQLLHYEVGQFYRTHHDYIEHEIDRSEGPRILTVFLYLNDVEEGGGTDFPELGITVMPKRGTVLIWPSVLNSAPDQVDRRTDHQALPVEKGEKFAANAWLHLRDYKETAERGCT